MKLIDADALKQEILTYMPERSEVFLIVDNQPEVISFVRNEKANMNEIDIIELEQVLAHCASYADCEGCPFDFMEDHGDACYHKMAEMSLDYINMLKEKISKYAKGE